MALDVFKRSSNGNVSKSPIISASLALIGYLIILCGAGVWYYLYVEDQRAFLTQRNFRILAEAGQNISDAVEGYAKILTALEPGLTIVESGISDKKYPSSQNCDRLLGHLLSDNHFKQIKIEGFSQGVPLNVSCSGSTNNTEPDTVESPKGKKGKKSPISNTARKKTSDIQTNFKLAFERTSHGAKILIFKEIPGECPEETRGIFEKKCFLRLTGELDLDTLLQRLPIEEIFADLLLADSDGNVIYQKPSNKHATSLKFQLLDILFKHQNSPPSIPTAERASSFPSKGKREVEISKANLLRQVPAKSSIPFGDETFLFFTQPGHLPFPHVKNGTEDIVFILGGLVPSRTFRAHAMEIPTPILLPSVFAFFALTFSLPLLKLWAMGPKDRLTIIDVVSLMFFSLMGTALLTFGLADLYAYFSAEKKLDVQLEVVSKHIKSGFVHELQLILNELDHQDENYASAYEICSEDKGSEIVRPDFLKYFWTNSNPILASCLDGKENSALEGFNEIPAANETKEPREVNDGNNSNLEYPYFNGLFWITLGGKVSNYFTIAKTGVNSPNLKERPYVQRVLENRLYDLNSGHQETPNPSFFIQPIYSWTSGKNEVIVSIASKANEAGNSKEGQDHVAVAAMEGKLLSLMYPVVPPGFGYAIIEENGKVLFHSDIKKNLRENLFNETNQNRRLHSLVLARNTAFADVRYAGNDSQFYIAPLGDEGLTLPWTLIVYRDKNLLRTANGVALFIATVLFALYATVILGGVLFAFLIVGDLKSGQAAWMWPKKEYHKRYTVIASINSFLVLSFGGLLLHGDQQAILFRSLAFAFIGIAVMYLILNQEWLLSKAKLAGLFRCDELFEHDSPRSHTISYTWMVMTFMLIFSAVPSLSIFTVAFDEEMLLLTQYVKGNLEQSLEQRKLDIKHFYMHGNFGKTDEYLTNGLLEKGSNLGINVFEKFLPKPSLIASMKHQPPREDDTLVSLRAGSCGVETRRAQLSVFPEMMNFSRECNTKEDDQIERGNLIEWLHAKLRPIYNDSSEQTGGFLPTLSEPSASKDSNVNRMIKASTFSAERHTHMGMALIFVAAISMLFHVYNLMSREYVVFVAILLGLSLSGLLIYFAIAPNSFLARAKGFDEGLGFVWGFLVLLFLMVLYRFPNFISQRIFYLGYQRPEECRLQLLNNAKNQDLIIRLQPPIFPHAINKAYKGGLLKQMRTDATSRIGKSFFTKLPLFQPHIELIDPLKHMEEEQDKNISTLRRLEKYHLSGKKVWVLSSIDLLNWSYRQFAEDPNSKHTREYRDRWVKVLENFHTVFYTPEREQGEQREFENLVSESPFKAKLSDEQIRIFTDECKVSPEHRKYGAALLQDKNQLINMLACPQATEKFPAFLLDALAIKYRAWWSICSDTEKLALFHLATDRFLNSQNPGVRTLLQKNLIRLNPDLQMINESFRQFILTVCEEEEISLLERKGPTSTWRKLVWPMGGFIILLAVFLISTQQDFRGLVLAFIPALPALFGILMKRLGSSTPQGTTSMGEA